MNEKILTAINIILKEDGQDSEFIEIEDDWGKSIGIGERILYGNYTKLRITAEDIAQIAKRNKAQ